GGQFEEVGGLKRERAEAIRAVFAGARFLAASSSSPFSLASLTLSFLAALSEGSAQLTFCCMTPLISSRASLRASMLTFAGVLLSCMDCDELSLLPESTHLGTCLPVPDLLASLMKPEVWR
ncbi:hypothetical protein HID58_053621, partial [Brassica napus]